MGKLKEKYFKAGIAEYAKRLGRYCKFEIVEVPDEKASESLSQAEMDEVMSKEGERILDKIKDREYVYALAIKGKERSSEEFAKEINKLKDKLFKENKAALEVGDESSAAVAEDIENQLKAFAMEYLKDDPSLDPYLSGAGGNIDNNFKNMYIMKGAIRNPDPTAKKEYEIAKSSFIDGISKDEYSLLARSLSGGPYSRAKKTELGGYWEKLVESATNMFTLDEPGSDCGTDKYLELVLTKDLSSLFMYSYIIKSDGKLEELTSDNVDKYINKKIKVRSALFCKGGFKLCNHCVGNFFYRRGGKNVGLACAQIPTKLKLKSMKAFHDSTVTTTEIDPMKAFGSK